VYVISAHAYIHEYVFARNCTHTYIHTYTFVHVLIYVLPPPLMKCVNRPVLWSKNYVFERSMRWLDQKKADNLKMIYMNTCVHIPVVNMYIDKYTYIYIYIYIYIYSCMYVHVYIYTHIHTYVKMCTHTYYSVYIYTHIYLYIYL